MTDVYFDQLTFSGGRSVPCHPAYQVVATTSSGRVLLVLPLPLPFPLPLPTPPATVGLAEGEDADAEAALSEHMGAAHVEEIERRRKETRFCMCNMLRDRETRGNEDPRGPFGLVKI